MERCTGHCCRRFALPATPCMLALIRRAAETGRGEERDGWWSSPVRAAHGGGRLSFTSREEAIQVCSMVAHVETLFEADMATVADRPGPGIFYNCSNLRPNGDCGVYETRPYLCRGYPYERKECAFKGCTLHGGPDA